tara:strand:- start:469 stop:648 length:180 start_codon:yes stop_codon:yes gene_type:complete
MGDDTEINLIICPSCDDDVIPNKIEGLKDFYTCPVCGTVIKIEKTITFEGDIDINPTYH